ncbi:hypothetical protein D3C71_1512130 [compost metagenome]
MLSFAQQTGKITDRRLSVKLCNDVLSLFIRNDNRIRMIINYMKILGRSLVAVRQEQRQGLAVLGLIILKISVIFPGCMQQSGHVLIKAGDRIIQP